LQRAGVLFPIIPECATRVRRNSGSRFAFSGLIQDQYRIGAAMVTSFMAAQITAQSRLQY